MRLFFILLLCAVLLIPSAQAAEAPKYVALTFSGGPSGYHTARLLDGLKARDAKATFFLTGARMAADPETVQRIFDEGHEIGIHSYHNQNLHPFSRRQIAADMVATRKLLPAGCRCRWFRSSGKIGDGLRQVAEVKNLAFLEWSVIGSEADTIRDGDVVLLGDAAASSVDAALILVDRLQARGFRLVTASELARLRGANIRPGQAYRRFEKSIPKFHSPIDNQATAEYTEFNK